MNASKRKELKEEALALVEAILPSDKYKVQKKEERLKEIINELTSDPIMTHPRYIRDNEELIKKIAVDIINTQMYRNPGRPFFKSSSLKMRIESKLGWMYKYQAISNFVSLEILRPLVYQGYLKQHTITKYEILKKVEL